MKYLPILAILLALSCSSKEQSQEVADAPVSEPTPQATSLLGKPLYAGDPSQAAIDKYEQRKATYLEDTSNIDNLIWYGRFAAYKGDYLEAIDIYSNGIKRFQEDARLYRHRGHRYISIREFDKAIADLEHASKLIEGKENKVEPDGIPNARNTPISTLHGNIWYHLGLAYYLKNDMPNALRAYQNCRASTQNDDNIVSSTHWLYMILRRMDSQEEANQYLEAVTDSMDIVENMAYHNACLFYKGSIAEEGLYQEGEDSPGNDALQYALANWHAYNGNDEKARSSIEKILAQPAWNSFGYIAAEADYARLNE
ncbi:MAG: hypothetical protein AAFX87_16155 [Bacteroidota bacterium]